MNVTFTQKGIGLSEMLRKQQVSLQLFPEMISVIDHHRAVLMGGYVLHS